MANFWEKIGMATCRRARAFFDALLMCGAFLIPSTLFVGNTWAAACLQASLSDGTYIGEMVDHTCCDALSTSRYYRSGITTEIVSVTSCSTCKGLAALTTYDINGLVNYNGAACEVYNVHSCTNPECDNCTSTSWAPYSTGYERKQTATCECGSCTKKYAYRCAAGYYGLPLGSASGCTKCNESFTNTCSVSNGTGSQTCYHTSSPAGSGSSSACTGTANCTSCCATSCSSGYHVSNCACVADATSSTITFRAKNYTMTQTCTSGQSVTLKSRNYMTSPVFTTYGWSFYGWATSTNSAEKEYDDEESITCPSSDLTLYGVWSRDIDFKYYNGSYAESVTTGTRTQYYFNTSATTAIAGIVRTFALSTQSSYGWQPMGWILDDSNYNGILDVSGSSEQNVTPAENSSDTVYWAIYERRPQIVYNKNGGTGSMSNSYCDDNQQIIAGGTAMGEDGMSEADCTLSDNGFTAPSNKEFAGWALGSASGTVYDEGETFHFPNKSWTSYNTYNVYATWATTGVTITLDKNGGTGMVTVTSISGDWPSVTNIGGGSDETITCIPGAVFRVSGVSKSNATYDGLSTSSSGTGNLSITCPSSSGSTYYMIWSCDAGYYYSSGTCTACSKGTYKSSAGNATSCTTASDKYYVDTTAATSQTQCPSGYRDGSDGGRDQESDCYGSCTKACSGNDTSSCPEHATCTYDTSATSSGTEYYSKNDCNASTILCPVDTITCDTGYHKSGSSCVANQCNITFKTGNTRLGAQYLFETGDSLNSISSMNSSVPSALKSNGWSFDGWATTYSTSSIGFSDGDDDAAICSSNGTSITLYGVWSRSVTLYRMGTNASGTSVSNSSRTQTYYNDSDSAASPTSITTYALYTSTAGGSWAPVGWVNSTTSTTVVKAQTGSSTVSYVVPVGDPNKLYALYSRTPEIVYNANGGSGTMSNSTCGTQYFIASSTTNGLAASCTLANNSFTAPSGKKFSKWAAGSASGTQYAAGASYAFPNTSWTGTKTYNGMYAIWENDTVTVSFNLNSGSGTAPSSVDCTIGASCTVINDNNRTGNVTTFYRAGYVFAGWFDTSAATGGNQLTSNTITTSVAKTYYARWTACSAGQFKPGSGTKANASCSTCAAGTYNGSTGQASCTTCPGGYTDGTNTGNTTTAQCQKQCSAGTSIATRFAESCTTPSGNWLTTATHLVYWGQVSTVTRCMNGYTASGTAASGHDAIADCKMSLSANQKMDSMTIPARYVRVKSTGSTANNDTHVVEIQAFTSNDGTGTNLLLNKTVSGAGTGSTNATDGQWVRGTYAWCSSGNNSVGLVWDMGATKNLGSIKFALYTDGRVYHDVEIAVSTDNSTWTTVLGPGEIATSNTDSPVGDLLVLSSPASSCATGYVSSAQTISYGTTTSCSAGSNTITLNANGGTGKIRTTLAATSITTTSQTKTFTCTTDSAMTLPTWVSVTTPTTDYTAHLTKAKKVFLGWSTDSSCEEANCVTSSATCPTGNTTYYAVWGTPVCNINNGTGTVTTTSSSNQPSCSVTCTAGYGTSGTKTGTAGQVNVDYTCTGNTITLTWANGGHGTAPTTPASCTYGGTFTAASAITGVTGYTFNKWSVNSKTFSAGATVNCTNADLGVTSGTATLTATWTGTTNTITLKKNGGTGTVRTTSNYTSTTDATMTCTSGTTNVALPTWVSSPGTTNYRTNITKSGAIFLGWSTSSTCTTASCASTSITCPTANTTYYAVWSACACGTDSHATCAEQSVDANTCKYKHTCTPGYFNTNNTEVISSNTMTCSECGSGKYCPSGAKSASNCSSLGGGLFTSTDLTTASANTQCYVTTTAGKWIEKSTDTALQNCTAGYYCPGDVKVYYTLAPGGSRVACGDGTFSAAGATACTECAAGSYSAAASASTSCVACPGGRTTSGTGTHYNATANTACSVTCSNSSNVATWTAPSWASNSVSNLCSIATCATNYTRTGSTGTSSSYVCTPNVIASASNKTLTYNGTTTSNGTAQSCANVTVTTPSSGATVKYSTTSNGTFSEDAPTLTTVGSTPVYYQVSANGYVTKTGSYTCTMNAKAMTVSASTKKLSYNGNAQSCANVTVTTPSSGASVTYSESASGSFTAAAPTLTTGDSKTVYYKVTGNNFAETTGSYLCTMAQVTLKTASNGSVTSSGNTTYGTNKTFYASTNNGGTLSVSPTSGDVVAIAAISSGTVTATPKKAGTQTITVTAAAAGDYAAASATYELTVNRANGTTTLSATAGTITYPTTTTTFTAQCSDNVKPSVSSASTSAATVAISDTATNNKYTVTVTWVAAGSGNDTASSVITVTCPQTDHYNESNKTYTATTAKGNSTTTVKDGSTTVTNATSTIVDGTFGTTKSLTATCSSGATPTVASATTAVATASINNGTITLTPVKAGDSVITVTCPATAGYKSSTSTFTYRVARATGATTLSATAGTITYPTTTTTFTAQCSDNAKPTASSATEAAATVAVSSTATNNKYTVTVTWVAAGSGNDTASSVITVTCPQTDHYASSSKTYTATTAKGNGSTTLSSTSSTLTYNGTGTTNTFTAKCADGVKPTATSSNTNAATVAVSSSADANGNYTVTNTWVGAGTGNNTATSTITVSCAAGAHYKSSSATHTLTTAKKANTLTLSASSGTVTYPEASKTFTVSTNTSSGTLSVASGTTTVATASLSGTTVTMIPKKSGTSTITVTSAATDYYKSATATYTLTVADKTITINKNGGTGTCGGATGTNAGSMTCTYADNTCTAPTWNSTSCSITNGSGTSQKILTGWTADSTSGTSVALGGDAKNVTSLYAKWENPVCTITNGTATDTVASNTPTCAVTCTNGYSQSGYTNTTTTFNKAGTANNKTVTASCLPRTYKVTLDPKRYTSASDTTGTAATTAGTTQYWYVYKKKATNGCYYYTKEVQSASDEVSANCIAGTGGVNITAPTLTGYTFGGYYTTKLGTGTQYVTSSGGTTGNIYSSVAGNSTLYAKWTAQTSTVTLKNGSTTVDTVTATYDAAMPTKNTSNANLTMPTSTNAVFMGYYDAATGGTQYYTAALASARTWNKTGAQTLNAQFASCTCTPGTGVSSCDPSGVSANKCQYSVTCSAGYSQSGGTPTTRAFTATNGTAATAAYTANCVKNSVITVTLDSKYYASSSATSGTAVTTNAAPTTIYEWYDKGWYKESGTSTAFTALTTKPAYTTYVFGGFYTGKAGTGDQIIDASGNLVSGTEKKLTANGTIYAKWTACTCGTDTNATCEVMTTSNNTCQYKHTCTTGYYHASNGATITNSSLTCTVCPAGSFCPAGATESTLCAAGAYTASTGQSACTACQNGTTNTGASATTQQACGTTCSNSANVRANDSTGWTTATWTNNTVTNACTIKTTGCAAKYYYNNNACSACPTGATYKRTTFPDDYYATSVSNPSIISGAGTTSISACKSSHTVTSTRGILIDQATYNTTTNKYDISTWHGWYKVNAGYYLTTKGACGTYAYYQVANVCPEGSYCPGKDGVVCNSSNQSTVHTTNFGLESCPTAYPNSAAGSDDINDCYLTLTKGNYVAEVGAGAVTCTCGGYCDSTANIYYGGTVSGRATTGGRTGCGAGKYNANTGSQASSACSTASAGYYASSSCSQTPCANWSYSGAGAASCTNCPTLDSGYAKSDSTSTGWTVYTKCVEVASAAPTNCASGKLQKIPTASGSTTWAAATVNTTLKAKQNYYVNGTACSACSDLASGFYPNSAANNTGGASACYTNNLSGKYVKTENATSATNCAAGTYKGTHTVNYGSTSSCDNCGDGTYSAAAAASCTACATGSYSEKASASTKCVACPAGRTTSVTGTHYNATANTACATTCTSITNLNTWGTQAWNSSNNTVTGLCTVGTCKAGAYKSGNTCPVCGADTYSASTGATSCTSCLTNYHTSGTALTSHDNSNDCKISCDGGYYVKTANDTTCTAVGAGKYAAASTIAQGAAGSTSSCSTGLTTIGFGAGADEAGDCGHKFHASTGVLYLRSNKKTTPSLNVRIGDTVFYGNMTKTEKNMSYGVSKKLKVKNADGTYYVHDDSVDEFPSEYTPVEYIQGSGSSYINTGVVPTLNTGAYVKVAITSFRSGNNIVLGATNTNAYAGGYPFAVDVKTNGAMLVHGGVSTSSASSSYSGNSISVTNTTNTIYELKNNYMNDGKGYIDTKSITLGSSTGMTTKPLHIFNLNTSAGGTSQYAPPGAKVYAVVLTEGDEITHNYIPVKRNSDNKCGFYDTMTGSFLTSATSTANTCQ